ncbi:hypothetical protein BLNAU_20603 [Blattamonas nauphoetae]|uniref:Uncharacterized protein n=1 Tax=Blattamonas nauphoetae TaxID=2049346 RepID=A0ABQ9WYB3_9EUKA|nr:hypothetical protein BLNAU_20603 [Blattamonas nauphoetae]
MTVKHDVPNKIVRDCVEKPHQMEPTTTIVDAMDLPQLASLVVSLTQVMEATNHRIQELKSIIVQKDEEIQSLQSRFTDFSDKYESTILANRHSKPQQYDPSSDYHRLVTTTEHRMNQVMNVQTNLETRLGDAEASIRDLIVVLQTKATITDLESVVKQMVLEEDLNTSLAAFVSRSQLADTLQHYLTRSQINPEEIHTKFSRLQSEIRNCPTMEQISPLLSRSDDLVTKDYLDSVLSVTAERTDSQLERVIHAQIESQRDTEEEVSRAKSQIETLNNRLTEYGQQTNSKIQSLSKTSAQLTTNTDNISTQFLRLQTEFQSLVARTQEVIGAMNDGVEDRMNQMMQTFINQQQKSQMPTPTQKPNRTMQDSALAPIDQQELFKQLETLRYSKETHERSLERLREDLDEIRQTAEDNSLRRTEELRSDLTALKSKLPLLQNEIETKAPLSDLQDLFSIIDSLDKKTARQFKALTPISRPSSNGPTPQTRRTSQPEQRKEMNETPGRLSAHISDPILFQEQPQSHSNSTDHFANDLSNLGDRVFDLEERLNHTSFRINHLDEIMTQVGKDVAQSASSLLSIAERQTSLREEHEVLTLDAVKKGKTIQEIQEALQTLTTTVESDGIRLDELDNRVDEQEEITQQTLKEHSQLIKHHINQQPNSLDSQLQNHLDDPSTVSVDFFDNSNSNAPAVGPTTSPIFKQRTNTPKGKPDATQKLGSTELSKYPVLITEEHSPPHPSHPALSQASPMKQDKSPVGQGRGGDTEELSAPETVLRVDKARIESTFRSTKKREESTVIECI